MKRFLCVAISIVLLLCLCGCSKNPSDDYLSVEVEIIYQSDVETVYEGDNDTTTSDTSASQNVDVTSQPGTSDKVETSEPATSSAVEQVKENIYYLNDANTLNNIKLNGRCQKSADGVELNFAASAIEFNTDSTGVLLEVTADEGVYYSVFVDGKVTIDRSITEKGTNYIALARNLSAGTHNIKFVRATEGKAGKMLTAVNLQLDVGKSITATAEKDILIEFLGDSLTNGYGNLTTSATKKASDIKYQNSLKAYPYLIADKLGFDYRIVSMSGIALKERNEETYKCPAYYDFYSLENYYKDKSQKYTSSNPQDVDIVVVNLGTNDSAKGWIDSKDAAKVDEYADIYTNLITNIGYRKDVKIVFVSGVGWCHAQKGAYDAAKAKLNTLGYNNVYVYDCLTYNSGGENHPSENEHQDVADVLIKFFKDNGIA